MGWLGVAVVGALALSGCVRFHADLTVHADNTVDGAYVLAIEKGAGASLGGSDADVSQQLYDDSGLQTSFLRSRTHGYSADGYSGIRVDFRDEPLASFRPTADRFGITREGDEFVVSGKASSTEADTSATPGQQADMRVTIAFPGPVTSSNGEIHGNTVTWNLVGGPPELQARASAIPSSSPLTGVIAALVVFGAAALLLWPRSAQGRSPARPPQRGAAGGAPRMAASPARSSRQAPTPPRSRAQRPSTPR